MAEFDDDRALRQGRRRSHKNGGRNCREHQLAHELSSQLTRRNRFFLVFGFQ
jgi:hypothetical protein